MKAYKLFRQMKDGKLSPLFINKKSRLPINEWMEAENHPTKGFTIRQGWHCTLEPKAPHLSEKNRVWYEVKIKRWELHERPKSQGGTWVLAQQMKIIKPVSRVDNIVWQIETDEWYYNGNFIQKQSQPSLAPYVVFKDTLEQEHVGVAYDFRHAKNVCEDNYNKTPLHSPLDYLS